MKVDVEICVAMHQRPLIHRLDGTTVVRLCHIVGHAAMDTDSVTPWALGMMQSAVGGSVPEPGCQQSAGSAVEPEPRIV